MIVRHESQGPSRLSQLSTVTGACGRLGGGTQGLRGNNLCDWWVFVGWALPTIGSRWAVPTLQSIRTRIRRVDNVISAQALTALKEVVAQLSRQLAAARKDSSTSSKPPSSDIV